jgi:hypothetical protein
MQELTDEIYNRVNLLQASFDIYRDLLQVVAHSQEEKENTELKLEIVKQEAIKHNLKIRQAIEKTGY